MSYICPKCEGSFTTIGELAVHHQQKHGLGYLCGMCGAVFDSREEVQEHFLDEHGLLEIPEEAKFICPVCGEAYFWESCLKAHMEEEHPEYKAEPTKITSALIIVAVIFLLILAFAFKRK